MPSNEVFNEILKKSFKIVDEAVREKDAFSKAVSITGDVKDLLAKIDQHNKNKAAKAQAGEVGFTKLRSQNTRIVPTPKPTSGSPQVKPVPPVFKNTPKIKVPRDNCELPYGHYAKEKHKMGNAKLLLGMLFLGGLLVVCVAVGLYQ